MHGKRRGKKQNENGEARRFRWPLSRPRGLVVYDAALLLEASSKYNHRQFGCSLTVGQLETGLREYCDYDGTDGKGRPDATMRAQKRWIYKIIFRPRYGYRRGPLQTVSQARLGFRTGGLAINVERLHHPSNLLPIFTRLSVWWIWGDSKRLRPHSSGSHKEKRKHWVNETADHQLSEASLERIQSSLVHASPAAPKPCVRLWAKPWDDATKPPYSIARAWAGGRMLDEGGLVCAWPHGRGPGDHLPLVARQAGASADEAI